MHQAHNRFYYPRQALFSFLIIIPVKNSEFLRTPCIALFLKFFGYSLLRLSKVFHQFGYHAHHRCHAVCRRILHAVEERIIFLLSKWNQLQNRAKRLSLPGTLGFITMHRAHLSSLWNTHPLFFCLLPCIIGKGSKFCCFHIFVFFITQGKDTYRSQSRQTDKETPNPK